MCTTCTHIQTTDYVPTSIISEENVRVIIEVLQKTELNNRGTEKSV